MFEENADSGDSFSFDEKRYKTRFVFGGMWEEFRNVVRGNHA